MRQTAQNGRTSNLHLLLSALESKVDRPFHFDVTRISATHNPCLRVFCILLMQERGELIQSFCDAGVVDRDIAGDVRNRIGLRTELRLWKTDEEVDRIVKDFDSARRGAIAADLHLHMAENFHGEAYVLPFCRYRRINGKGGTASVFEAFIQHDLVKDKKLQRVLIRSKVIDKEYGPCFRVAIKSYSDDMKSVYDTERRAFNGLRLRYENTRDSPAIVRDLGCYTHEIQVKDRHRFQTRLSHNIVLEYGDADLEECWADLTTVPPVRFEEILRYWEALLDIAKAIQVVHRVHSGWDDRDDKPRQYDGWHADVKPDNILSVDGKLKLADFGFARFKRSSIDGTAPLLVMTGGTDTYGAPEFSRWAKRPSAVNQTIDIWSFGCVLSVTATWVVLGYQGVLQYQTLRLLNNDGKQRDRFHDGQDVLPQIAAWHKYLKSSLRAFDTTTGLVLDLIDMKMLKKDPRDRLKSDELCEELEDLLRQARRDYETKLKKGEVARIGKDVGEALLVVEQAATNKDSAHQKTASTTDIKVHLRSNNQPSRPFEVSLNPSSRLSTRIGKAETIQKVPLVKTSQREGTLREELRREAHLTVIPAGPIDENENRPDDVESNGIVTAPPENISDYPDSIFGIQDPFATESDEVGTNLFGHHSQPTLPNHIYGLDFDIIQVRKDLEERKERDRNRYFRFIRPSVDMGVFHRALSTYIKERDMVLVVDNDYTMVDYYPALSFVAETLAMQLIGLDDDGIDLKFTVNRSTINKRSLDANRLKGFDGVNTLRKHLLAARPKRARTADREKLTDIVSTLERIFKEYIRSVSLKAMTLIVLTNGSWSGSQSAQKMNDTIISFAKWLERKGFGGRHFSITFIRFGDDPKSTKRLRYLDDELCRARGVGDFIDAMTWRAPVRKMLLGSFSDPIDAVPDRSENERDIAADLAPLFEAFNKEVRS